jgi:hypothetical protein
MIKIIWDTWAFKELKNKLNINNLKEFELLPEKLENKKIKLLENWKKQCSDDLNWLKVDLEKSRHDLDTYISSKNLDNFISKIKSIFIIYNKNRKIWEYLKKINDIEEHFEEYSMNKVNNEIQAITYEENLIESLKKFYYWAVWEEKVVWEFKNMNFNWILINDFNQDFNHPIFTKWWSDRIMSIQIDHIFINNKWIFLIETKNRSKNSKETFKFSPIQQIERSWHAFYIYLSKIFKSDKFLRFQKMPKIYKIVVFIWWAKIYTDKPYTKVLYINELRKYIETRSDDIHNEEIDYLSDILVNS